MVFPLTTVKNPLLSLLKKISKSNHRAQSGLVKAFVSNNPSYGLLNAWAELEYQVNKNHKPSSKKSSSKQIIAFVSDSLSLSNSDQKRLKSISRQRNGVAHALGGRTSPTWSDVWFVLRVSKKYRKVNI
jgi:hypothetical protein